MMRIRRKRQHRQQPIIDNKDLILLLNKPEHAFYSHQFLFRHLNDNSDLHKWPVMNAMTKRAFDCSILTYCDEFSLYNLS